MKYSHSIKQYKCRECGQNYNKHISSCYACNAQSLYTITIPYYIDYYINYKWYNPFSWFNKTTNSNKGKNNG